MKGKIKRLSIMAVISILAIVFAVIGGITTASDAGASQTSSVSGDPVSDLEEIRKAVEEKGAKWVADITPVSELSIEEKKRLCGVRGFPNLMGEKAPGFAGNARTTKGMYSGRAQFAVPHKGTIIRTWDTSTYPWGVGFDDEDVWISFFGVDNWDGEHTVDGLLVNSFTTTAWEGAWPGDMAWDGSHLWQVNVGGDNCIYQLDPTTGAVVNTICDPSNTWDWISQHGLAYDSSTDTFYIGGWYQDMIYQIEGLSGANPGTIINQWGPYDIEIAGLAWDSTRDILWISTNNWGDTIYGFDPSTSDFTAAFAHPDYGSHWTGAGLACDGDGNLWTVSQSTHTAYLIEPPAPNPDAHDWRNVGGVDWTTPIRDQGACGSCVAFGTLGALEPTKRIEENDPTYPVDLSEQHLFSCGGGSCTWGWWIGSGAEHVRISGVPDEACYPYISGDGNDYPCSDTCTDWVQRAVKISDWDWVDPHPPAIEGFLLEAPLIGGMDVYEDFFDYDEGIYEHVWGDLLGGHCIAIVGYGWDPDVGGYWICKNSWGTAWGEEGWFRIKYGECYIEGMVLQMEGVIQPLGKPDLVIEKSVTIKDGNFTVNYTVTNIGDGPAGASTTCKLVDGELMESQTCPALGSGESYSGSFEPEECPCGETLNVTVCADNDDAVAESDETNNCEVNVVECPKLPDLVIDKIWTKERKDRCKVYFVVENIGCAPAPKNHHATLLVNDQAVEEKRIRKLLGPGEQYESSFRTTVSCTDVIRVCADNFKVIDELDENNNCLVLEEKPDLVIENKREEWVNETHYNVTYVIHNKGTAIAPGGHRTTLYVDGVAIEHKIVPDDLEHCQTYTDTFDTVIECTEPKDIIKVCADNDEIIDEINEDNNCLQNEWICDEVVEKPDLVIEKKWEKERRGKYKVYFVVKNIGTATAPKGHHITLSVDDEEIEHKLIRRALRPGKTYRSSFKTKVECTGDFDTIEVCADDFNFVDELDETNNCLENEWIGKKGD